MDRVDRRPITHGTQSPETNGIARPFDGAGASPNGADTLNELVKFIAAHAHLPKGAATALALWILHTWAVSGSWYRPRLVLSSPSRQCGKTTVLKILEMLVNKPRYSASMTPAAMFRLIAKAEPTLLIDEADTFVAGNDDLRGIINAGFEQNGVITRCVGDSHEPRDFPCSCPLALAAIRTLPDTIVDRAIVIPMERKPKGSTLARLRSDRYDDYQHLRRAMSAWAKSNASKLKDAEPTTPDLGSHRAEDCWRPLLAIADLAGGPWPERARKAAVELSQSVHIASDEDLGLRLLADICWLFDQQASDRITSQTLADKLGEMEDRPWPEYGRGKPITPTQIARLLRPFGISPQTVRSFMEPNGLGGYKDTAKGYTRAQFRKAWDTYL